AVALLALARSARGCLIVSHFVSHWMGDGIPTYLHIVVSWGWNQIRRKQAMPLYMDMHKNVQGLTAEGVAEAHKKDLEIQGKHGVTYLHYWYNEADGTVFCLCEAPSKEAAAAVHREAHGGVADEIVEVKEGI